MNNISGESLEKLKERKLVSFFLFLFSCRTEQRVEILLDYKITLEAFWLVLSALKPLRATEPSRRFGVAVVEADAKAKVAVAKARVADAEASARLRVLDAEARAAEAQAATKVRVATAESLEVDLKIVKLRKELENLTGECEVKEYLCILSVRPSLCLSVTACFSD